MKLQPWIESKAWDENYFSPSLLGEELEIFRSGVSFPLLTSLIDGCHGKPIWTKSVAETNTSSLFESLKKLILKYGASWFYITAPDN